MKILITGGTGFIGSHLLRRWAGVHEVCALVRESPPEWSPPEIHWVRQDLVHHLDRTKLPRRTETIVHLAQSRFCKEFPQSAPDMFYVNAESTFNLLEFARGRGVKRFIMASTGAVTLPSTDFYSSTKRCAEALAGSYGEFFSVIIPRLFFPYGHGQQQTRLMPQLFRKVKAKETITIDGNPGMHMNPIFIDDVVEVFNGLLGLHHSATLDVSGPEVLTVSGIVHRMEGIVGHFTDVKYKKPPQATWNLVGDTAGMSVLTGVKPEVGIDEGIMRMVNW